MIETIDAIPGLDKDATLAEHEEGNRCPGGQPRQAIRDEGIYILISKRDHVISHVLVRERYADVLPIEKRDAIHEAFLEEFKKKDFDGGLT